MSTVNATAIKPTYNCCNVMIWPMTSESNETYGDGIDFTGKLMTYDDQVSSNTAKLYGDGIIAQVDIDETDGTLTLGLIDVPQTAYEKLFGTPAAVGTTIKTIAETGEEAPPYCCVALMAQTGPNTYNFRKWPKVRFAKMNETVQQKEENRNYATPTLTGTFIKCKRLGYKRAKVWDVDITSEGGAAFKTSWYASPDFYYEGQTIS